MTDLARLRSALRVDEGSKPTPYKDSLNLWTIATGRCLETNPLTGAELKFLLDRGWIKIEITPEGDDYLLDNGIAEAVKQCSTRFEFWPTLNDARQNSLINMVFQLGIAKVLQFKKMIAALRFGEWHAVETEALDSDWAQQTPTRAKRVAHQLATGNWS